MRRFGFVAAIAFGLTMALAPVKALAEEPDPTIGAVVEDSEGFSEDQQELSATSPSSEDTAQVVPSDNGAEAAEGDNSDAGDSQDSIDTIEAIGDGEAKEAAFDETAGVLTSDKTDKSPAIEDNTVYTIAPSAQSTAIVGVAGNNSASGTNVQLSAGQNALGGYWRASEQADGSFTLVSLLNDLTMAIVGTPAAGANVNAVSGTGTKWVFKDNGDDTVSIAPKGYDSLRLDLSGARTTAGTNVQVYTSNGTAAQRFVLKAAEALTEALRDGDKNLDEGVVSVATSLGEGKVLDIAGATKANGGNVQIYDSNKTLAQKYLLSYAGNGLYSLKNASSGKYLDVYGGAVTSGANVQQYTGNGTLAQFWYFVKNSDGTYFIRSAKSGLSLSVKGSSTNNCTNVELESVRDYKRQKFDVLKANFFDDGQVLRLSPAHATSLVVAVAQNSADAGANVVLAQPDDRLGEWWCVKSANGNAFVLANLRGDMVLKVNGAVANSANVNVASSSATTWIVRVSDGGAITLSPKGKLSYALDIQGAGKTAGTNVQIYKANGTAAQRFVVTLNAPLTQAARSAQALDEGVYMIKSALGGSFVLDVAGASKEQYANVQIYTSNSTQAQKFQLLSMGNGLYRIQSLNSGLFLGVLHGATTNGANVNQFKRNEILSQHWYLVKSGSGYAICNAKSGLALDVAGAKNANGANVQIYQANGSAAQRWSISAVQVISDGTYAFSSDLTYYGMLVLDVAGASKTSGANVQVYQSNGTNAQKWTLTFLGSKGYKIVSKNSGLSLAVKDASSANGGNIVQESDTGSASQRWQILLDPSGGYIFKNMASGKVLDVTGGKSDNGVNVQQYTANGSKAQSWHIKTDHNPLPAGKVGQLVSRMIYYTDIVSVGYDQLTPDRWNIKNGGECDCSSLVINCLREAGFNTGDVSSHIGKVNAGEPSAGCTYTGNMSKILTSMKDDDGKSWSRLSFSLSKLRPGDILLNDAYHTCVVISGSGSTALIAQASIDENNYGWGGKAGDQTGYETNIKQAYVYGHGGWDCILRYNG